MTSSALGEIPFRIRVGVIDSDSTLDEELLRSEISKLFDDESHKLLRTTERTPIVFEFEQLTRDNLTESDVLVVVDHSSASLDLLQSARAQRRPIVSVTRSDSSEIVIERGHGLNAHSISALEKFNSYVVPEREQKSYIENSYSTFFTADDGIPKEIKDIVREKLLPYYVRASLLAKSNQRIYRRAGVLVYSLSTLAVGTVAIGTLVHDVSVVAFAVELLLLLTILVTILHANHKRSHKNWIQARYVAERVRAAVFLTACGVKPSEIAVPANTGVTGKPDQWMLMAFAEITRRLPRLNPCHGESCERFVTFVRRRWLVKQIEFHRQKAAKAQRMNHLLERIGIILFATAVLAAGLHLLFAAFHMESWENPLTFAAIFLPAAGAAIGGIRSHREYSRLATRSSNMAISLKALDEQLASVTNPEEFRSAMLQIEELLLLELQDWLVLMSVAKLEAT